MNMKSKLEIESEQGIRYAYVAGFFCILLHVL